MVVVLQFCIFAVAALGCVSLLRGWHLMRRSSVSDVLGFRFSFLRQLAAQHVGLLRRGGLSFAIRRRRWYHRQIDALGLTPAISSGDDGFDDAYVVVTDDPRDVARLLAAPDLRRDVGALFDLGARSLQATRTRIWCALNSLALARSDDDPAPYLDVLGRISDHMSVGVSGRWPAPAGPRRGLAAVAVLAVQAGLLALGLFGMWLTALDPVLTVDPDALAVTGLAAGTLMAMLWFFGLLALFRNSPYIYPVLAGFALYGLAGFALAGVPVVRAINVLPTLSPVEVTLQPIVARVCTLQCTRSRFSFPRTMRFAYSSDAACTPAARQAARSQKLREPPHCIRGTWFEYSLSIRDWRGGGAFTVTPDVAFFDSVRTGQMVSVPVHQGAFGLGWVDPGDIRAR